MSEHDEWFPPKEEQSDFATNTESGIDWSKQAQEQQPYDAPSQLSVDWGSGEYIPMSVTDAEEYDGPYDASALFSAQTFTTARKLMRSDFLVRAINYTEAPNEYGTTVTIGG